MPLQKLVELPPPVSVISIAARLEDFSSSLFSESRSSCRKSPSTTVQATFPASPS